MDIDLFLQRLDNVKGGPSQFTARCPAHKDEHNSLSVHNGNNGRILFFCHAGCSFSSIIEVMGLRMEDVMPKRERSETNLQNCKKDSTLDKHIPEACYQYHDSTNNLLFEVVRYPNKHFRQRRYENEIPVYNLNGIEPVLYRLPDILDKISKKNADIYLCEGEKDAERLCTFGYTATTAPMGAGKWRPQYTESLHGAERVILLPDHDEAGYRHAMQVGEALCKQNIATYVCKLPKLWSNLPEKGDISDVIDAMGEDIILQIPAVMQPFAIFKEHAQLPFSAQQESPFLQPISVFLHNEYKTVLQREQAKPHIQTGFASLDAQLGGHLYAGLYIIGSVSSLGKTAFCLQMADFIAAQGFDVLFFSLEMSRFEMVSRSISRILFEQSRFTRSYSVTQLLQGAVDAPAFETAFGTYVREQGAHLYYEEGAPMGTTIEHIVSTATQLAHACKTAPVIFVDYLQMIHPGDVRLSDKQATDMHVTRLKRLSRELDCPVIAISSFNRQNYSEAVNLASFKESGAIEYSADFVLGLQAQGVQHAASSPDEKKAARLVQAATLSAKQKDPRPVEAVVLKNRRGPASASFSLEFYAKDNFFVEG